MANFYEAIVSKISNPNEAKNLILGEISSILKSKNIKIDELPISLNYIQKSYKLKSSGKISSINFKKLLQLLANSNKKIDEIIEENNLISKEKISLDEIFKKIKKNYKIELQRYLDGENRLKGFLIGQFMRITKGNTDPKEIAKYIENIKK
jgi:aspartyl-tRNA(Asn)/glutamyl-tRNA(Gln) amidotransferase subunit B